MHWTAIQEPLPVAALTATKSPLPSTPQRHLNSQSCQLRQPIQEPTGLSSMQTTQLHVLPFWSHIQSQGTCKSQKQAQSHQALQALSLTLMLRILVKEMKCQLINGLAERHSHAINGFCKSKDDLVQPPLSASLAFFPQQTQETHSVCHRAALA